jgi:hypothetical protein
MTFWYLIAANRIRGAFPDEMRQLLAPQRANTVSDFILVKPASSRRFRGNREQSSVHHEAARPACRLALFGKTLRAHAVVEHLFRMFGGFSEL